MVIAIEIYSVPNNLPLNELKEILNSSQLAWQSDLVESVRAAQSAIRTVDIADMNAASQQLKNALSNIQPIEYDYHAELRETAKVLASVLAEYKPLMEQHQEFLRSIGPLLKQIELEPAPTWKRLPLNLQLFGQPLEPTDTPEENIDADPSEEDCIDEETADYLASATYQMQTVLAPEQDVPFDRLRAFFSGITWEKAITILNTILTILTLIQGYMPDEELQHNNELAETAIVQQQEADARTYEQNEEIIELLTEISDKLNNSDTDSDTATDLNEISQHDCCNNCHNGQQ